jgi:hypothetical protein
MIPRQFSYPLAAAENIAAGANTITVSDTVSGTLRFAILEYAGVATANSLDVIASSQGTTPRPTAETRRLMKLETMFPPNETQNLSPKRRYNLQP